MKYFTIQWWSGGNENADSAFDDYRRYLDTIVHELPDSIRQLVNDISLHDAHLLRLRAVLPDRRLVLELDGYGYDPQSKSHFERHFRLTYDGVECITSTTDPDTGLPGPHGFGDLGYDEIERIQSDLYEHRMLFSTGIELQVRFSKLSLWHGDHRADQTNDESA